MLWLILIMLVVAAAIPIEAVAGMPRWGWITVTVIGAGTAFALLSQAGQS